MEELGEIYHIGKICQCIYQEVTVFLVVSYISYTTSGTILDQKYFLHLKLVHNKETSVNTIAVFYSSHTCECLHFSYGEVISVWWMVGLLINCIAGAKVISCVLSSTHWALSDRINGSTLSEWPWTAAVVCFVWFFSIYLQMIFQRNISFFFPKSSISSTAETQDRWEPVLVHWLLSVIVIITPVNGISFTSALDTQTPVPLSGETGCSRGSECVFRAAWAKIRDSEIVPSEEWGL